MIASAPALDPGLDVLATLAPQLDPNFLIWMFAPGTGGTLTKRPVSRDGRHFTSYKDAEHRGTFAEISAAYRALKRDGDHRFGIGCAFFDGPLVAGDFDAHPTLNPVVAEVLDRYPGYIERSVGSDGRHAIASTRTPIRNFKNLPERVELIAFGFLALTGHVIDGHRDILDATDLLTDLDRRFRRTPEPISTAAPDYIPEGRRGFEDMSPDDLPPTVDHLSDDDLFTLAASAGNGAKFCTLWAGDWSAYPSQSEADLALVCLLAFWTQRNSDRIDRLFRRSGLYRADKWDRDDYRERTIAKATTHTRDVYTPSERPVITESPAPEPSSVFNTDVPPTAPIAEDVAPKPYTFACAVGPDHFLAQWIDYARQRTDAAHEYHEAAGLALLAAATPNVPAQLAPYPNGLPTNIYALLLGDSTISRKTTSKDFARDVQTRALPNSLSADQFSPEGFVEQLAGRPHDSTTLYVDEFGEMLDKLHHAKHMAGLRGLLMTVYGGDDYTYRKHSKRKKGQGSEKYEDEDRIVGPHLSILGATTPAAFDVLVEADVICGLLPRFAIIMPTSKPAQTVR